MQIGPCHHVVGRPAGEPVQTEPSQYRTESDLDTGDFQMVVAAVSQHHVGDTGEALAGDVHDLRVENVTRQQYFVDAQHVGERRHRGAAPVGRQPDVVAANGADGLPWQEQIVCMPAAHQDSIDHGRTAAPLDAHRQIREAAEQPAIGIAHVLADHPAEQQHLRTMPQPWWEVGRKRPGHPDRRPKTFA